MYTIDILVRTGPLSRVCQILIFLNRIIINRDMANFVKPCFPMLSSNYREAVVNYLQWGATNKWCGGGNPEFLL